MTGTVLVGGYVPTPVLPLPVLEARIDFTIAEWQFRSGYVTEGWNTVVNKLYVDYGQAYAEYGHSWDTIIFNMPIYL